MIGQSNQSKYLDEYSSSYLIKICLPIAIIVSWFSCLFVCFFSMIWFLFELMRLKTLNEYEQMTWILMSLSFAAARSKKAVLHQVSSLYLALIFICLHFILMEQILGIISTPKKNSWSDMLTEWDVMFMFFYYREDGLGNPLYVWQMICAGKGTEPEWNESFVFTISDGASELTLKIMDSDTGTADDIVGEATWVSRSAEFSFI